MKTIVLDFETYYDREYSLRKMTPVEYIMDTRFDIHGCAMHYNGLGTWLEKPQLFEMLRQIDETKTKIAIVSHNALFDMCVLSWRCNFVPTLMIDTLSLARAWWMPHLRGVSLAKVTSYMGLAPKGDVIHKVIGLTRAQIIAAGLYDQLKDYAIHDAELCNAIYQRIMGEGFPVQELIVMDTVIRMATTPKFVLNPTKLAEHLHVTQEGKRQLLERCGVVDPKELTSNEKFATILRSLGIEPEMKTSPTTGLPAYAFAKTDQFMADLDEHDDPDVQAIAAARVGIKSTIEESRTQRFLNIANCQWPQRIAGELRPAGDLKWMPVPLKYSGAHTHRLSGDWKLNMQNMRRGSKLRDALEAPPGRRVVKADASQIEARLVVAFSGQDDVVKMFEDKVDTYCALATKVFGFPVTKKGNPIERFVGKTGVLGLGFGLGWMKFQSAIRAKSRIEVKQEVILSDDQAMNVVSVYRRENHKVTQMWRKLGDMIVAMTRPDCNIQLGPITFLHEKVRLPNGMFLYYNDLKYEHDEWRFTYAGIRIRIYGGKLMENIIQALARICTMGAAVRMRKRFPDVELAHQCHDELVYLPEEERAQEIYDALMYEMCVRPDWMPTLPLAAEGGIYLTYGGE